jgi:secreted trypsin-like serine protease
MSIQKRTSFRISLFLICVSVWACGSGSDEGAAPISETIVDGNLDQEGLYPHIVLVDSGCTGTLITPKHVLTAAHCVCIKQDAADGSWTKNADYCKSTATITFVDSMDGKPTQKIMVGQTSVHPGYVMATNPKGRVTDSQSDMAIVTLSQCAPSAVKPISLIPEAPALAAGGVSLGRRHQRD